MYNRYVRNDTGAYQRIPTQRSGSPPKHESTTRENEKPPCGDPWQREGASPLGGLFGRDGLLSGILDKLKLNDLDTGDLLLLVILFLLFRDGGDEELLIALGLLLIL